MPQPKKICIANFTKLWNWTSSLKIRQAVRKVTAKCCQCLFAKPNLRPISQHFHQCPRWQNSHSNYLRQLLTNNIAHARVGQRGESGSRISRRNESIQNLAIQNIYGRRRQQTGKETWDCWDLAPQDNLNPTHFRFSSGRKGKKFWEMYKLYIGAYYSIQFFNVINSLCSHFLVNKIVLTYNIQQCFKKAL